MAQRRHFASMKDLLPSVLTRIAEESGRPAGLQPFWEEIVGPTAARSAVVADLRGGVLGVNVSDVNWLKELEPRKDFLLQRLNERLEGAPIKAIAFRVGR